MNFLSNSCISLEPYTLENASKIVNWLNDEVINKFFPHNLPSTIDRIKKVIRFINESNTNLGFIIKYKENNLELGILEVKNIDYISQQCELEIAIGEKNYFKKNIATQAFQLIEKYLFSELHIAKIKLNVRNDNISMIKLARKSGYIREGLLRNEWLIDGLYHDVAIYAKFKDIKVFAENSALDIIGNTPSIKLNNIMRKYNFNTNIFAKLEYLNPSGSIKDRTAYYIINEGKRNNKITEATTLVASTSGNLGVSLSMIASILKLNVIVVSPENVIPDSKLQLITTLGAKVIFTPLNKGYEESVRVADELCKKNNNYYNCNQFSNFDNVLAHEKTTAIEIINTFGNSLDAIILTVGSGGTISGIGNVLKKYFPKIKIIAVEPKDCTVLSKTKVIKDHYILGIGPGFIPEILNKDIIDDVILVDHIDSYNECIELANEEGIFCGMSSGSALLATKKFCQQNPQCKNVLTIFPDNGLRYYHNNGIFTKHIEQYAKDRDLINKYE